MVGWGGGGSKTTVCIFNIDFGSFWHAFAKGPISENHLINNADTVDNNNSIILPVIPSPIFSNLIIVGFFLWVISLLITNGKKHCVSSN